MVHMLHAATSSTNQTAAQATLTSCIQALLGHLLLHSLRRSISCAAETAAG